MHPSFYEEPAPKPQQPQQSIAAVPSRSDVPGDMEVVQQQQGQQISGAEAAKGLAGGEVDGVVAGQKHSEFWMRVSLHSRGCRWPANASSSEKRTWGEGFTVSRYSGSQDTCCWLGTWRGKWGLLCCLCSACFVIAYCALMLVLLAVFTYFALSSSFSCT